MQDPQILTALFVAVSHYIIICKVMHGAAAGIWGGCRRGLVGLVEPSKLTTMRHYNVLSWPKNPKNVISKEKSLKIF